MVVDSGEYAGISWGGTSGQDFGLAFSQAGIIQMGQFTAGVESNIQAGYINETIPSSIPLTWTLAFGNSTATLSVSYGGAEYTITGPVADDTTTVGLYFAKGGGAVPVSTCSFFRVTHP